MRIVLLILFSTVLPGCGFIIENITDLSAKPKLPGILDIPVQPVYLQANDSYLQANGSCQGYQVIEFTYSSELTPNRTVFGKCENDLVSTRLDVLDGDKKQIFTVKIVGYVAAPSTPENLPPQLTVVYNPPVRMIAGFGITSGGGKMTSGSAQIINNSVGEVFVGTQTSASAKSRNGLQGSIDP